MADEQRKQHGQLIAKAWTDEAFKARLPSSRVLADTSVVAPVPVE